jgi:acylphosphatase
LTEKRDRMDLHISISGRVQGVGYRQWFRGRALTAGVSGWVRNCVDGTVEAALSGPAESVERLVLEAGQGPRGADVQDVRRLEAAPPRLDGGGQTFFIAATDSFPRKGRDTPHSP